MSWEYGRADISHTEINGREVYYLATDCAYISKETTSYLYHFYGVVPLENGMYYVVEGSSETDADALKMETYRNFLALE